MDWNALLNGAIVAVGIPLLFFVWTLILKPASVEGFGHKCGRFLSVFLRQKVGKKPGEKIEGRLKGTVNDFIRGLFLGMDSDN